MWWVASAMVVGVLKPLHHYISHDMRANLTYAIPYIVYIYNHMYNHVYIYTMEINRRTNHRCPNPPFSSPWTNWIQTNAKRYSDTVTPPRAWSIHTHKSQTSPNHPSMSFPSSCKVFVVSGVVYGSGFNWWVEPTKGIAQVQQRRPPSILLSCIPRLSTKQFLLARKLDDPTKKGLCRVCRKSCVWHAE